jgi:holliday junction DNA helicase RuvA
MYEYVTGTVQAVLADAVVVDVGGIGYRVCVAKTCPSRCTPLGHTIKLAVDLIIREDAHTLYGFFSTHDRDFFRLLQQVSGVGPRVALNILSHAPASQISTMLVRKDIAALSSISGIGKKMAERLAVELNEKVSEFITSELPNSTGAGQAAIRALQTLGFSISEAKEAISSAQKHVSPTGTIEQLVQYALSTKR